MSYNSCPKLPRAELPKESVFDEPPPDLDGNPKFGEILAAIGPASAFQPEVQDLLTHQADGIEYVDIKGPSSAHRREGRRAAGDGSYVISRIDSSNKLSTGYNNCLGVAVVGVDKLTRQNISLLLHEYPTECTEEQAQEFTADFEQALTELRERVEPGTIDAVLFGGVYQDGLVPDTKKMFAQEYEQSLTQVSGVIRQTLGVDTHVISAPQNGKEGSSLAVVLDTANRRLHILGHSETQAPAPIDNGFAASEFRERSQTWEPHTGAGLEARSTESLPN